MGQCNWDSKKNCVSLHAIKDFGDEKERDKNTIINNNKKMKKTITLLFVLLVRLTAQAELRSGHFFKTLQSENLTEQKAVECFNQWFALPQETEWRKVGERTDKLGMTRVEYRQYVSGVEVEHSQVLLHVKDGRVQTANGTVMETPQAPAKLRRYAKGYRDGTPTDLLGRKLYLVSTKDGYRYATKALSADRSEWIYTDTDTGEVLKRIPTRYNLTAEPVTVTGRSIYSGEVQMDASRDSESGTYLLWDQQRNIHTMIGATLPSLSYRDMSPDLFVANFPQYEETLPVPMGEMTDEIWKEWLENVNWDTTDMTTYITRNALYATNTEPHFDSYVLSTLTIDRLATRDKEGNQTEIVPTNDNPFPLRIEILYYYTDGMVERADINVTSFPVTLDLKRFNDEIPAAGVDIVFYTLVENEKTEEEGDLIWRYVTYLTLMPDGSGQTKWNYSEVKASATYEKGPWSAADIHWGMQHTYDFYKTFFDRDSFDDAGAPIYNLFYVPDGYSSGSYILATSMNNAGAANLGSSQMIYGMGSREVGYSSMYPVVELSVMAHEFTHMVTNATAHLVYQGESGALNESFSDLMGIGVKKYVQGNDAPWTIADGVMVYFSNMRSLAFPKTSMDGAYPCPDTYKGEYWLDTEEERDHGGVHINSGVQNKWFYLLTDGDSGTNDNDYSYQVEGIGIEKSQQIAYRTLTEYATRESQYADIRLASLQAAEDLYGANSVEVEAVGEAWSAVGVDENQTGIESIQNSKFKIQNEDAIYNLAGQRLNKMQKGINIVNGKKILK